MHDSRGFKGPEEGIRLLSNCGKCSPVELCFGKAAAVHSGIVHSTMAPLWL